MNQLCDCCTAIEPVVPVSEANPPGAAALHYRVGNYAEFLETMLARLTGLTLEVPSASGNGTDIVTPLAKLTTRDPADPAIALLDAWAVIADVLSFYQERIANEGYLPTATERRSILELARLIGYRLRPGVAASVKLAFTVTSDFAGTIPAGARAQSVPGSGELPQFFETSAPFEARGVWNTLLPRLQRPQLITPGMVGANNVPLVTGADVIDSVYLDGIATNLKPGDALFFIFGPDTSVSADPRQQYLRLAADVDAQAEQKRTEITLNLVIPPDRSPVDQLQLNADKADYLFAGSGIAAEVKAILVTVIPNIIAASRVGQPFGPILQPAIARIMLKREVAQKRGFRRIVAWLSMLLRAMQRMSLGANSGFGPVVITSPNGEDDDDDDNITLTPLPTTLATSPLARLGDIVSALSVAPSVQPANPLRLTRDVSRSFTPQSDAAPRLLATLHPAAKSSLYQAWSAAATPAGRVEVHAARVKASLFAANWVGQARVVQNSPVAFTSPTITTAWGAAFSQLSTLPEIPLDTTYDQIKPGTWVAIDRPDVNTNGVPDGDRIVTYHVVASVRTAAMATGAPPSSGSSVPGALAAIIPSSDGTGFSAKVTLLKLDPPWLDEIFGDAHNAAVTSTAVLRDTIVYAQSEQLALTDEPLDIDVGGGSVDLAQVYDGLEPGRWIIVSGTRTDIPDVTGVVTSELAMIAGVAQGAQVPMSIPFPLSSPPFATVHYITDTNAFGDRLVVGTLQDPSGAQIGGLGQPAILNQQYSNQVELAPGVYASAYVPTSLERGGQFKAFAGLLVDPDNGVPFEGAIIPKDRLGQGLFAWRISSQTLHTILTFASPLAYQYDRGSVTIYGNVSDATHGQSTGEILGDGDASRTFAKFPLSQSPLTYVSAPTPSGVASTLTVRVNELAWHELNDLGAATATQRAYVTSEDDAGKTSVIFGNGVHGLRLPTGTANVKATYRYGMGKAGNVRAGQISQLATRPLGLQGVINPLAASGGADADTADAARANAPMAVMALDRLVSVRDYADFARTYAGIGKAVAARLSDGRQQLVHVTVAGAEDVPITPGSDLYSNLLRSLQTFGDPHLPVAVGIRRVKLLVIQAGIALLPDYDWENVVPKVRAALLALFAFDARGLGQTAYLSEAVAAAQGVEGVAYVDVTRFAGVAEAITPAELAALGTTLGLAPFVQAELARVDSTAPIGTPQRLVPAELVFLTPDIPDTLILKQLGG